jgi:hypothetical protein
MAANYRDWTSAEMATNSSRLTGKCGVAANFSRWAAEIQPQLVNVFQYIHIYIHTMYMHTYDQV